MGFEEEQSRAKELNAQTNGLTSGISIGIGLTFLLKAIIGSDVYTTTDQNEKTKFIIKYEKISD
ncbi:MAG: hypothetical protein ACP5NV_06540 [Candidatus Woesearchaeota archaeon]